jgi:hypothetical protein
MDVNEVGSRRTVGAGIWLWREAIGPLYYFGDIIDGDMFLATSRKLMVVLCHVFERISSHLARNYK